MTVHNKYISDEELMVNIKGNSYTSYNSLFIRHYICLCKYVYSIILNKEETEDIVQELFLKLWKNRTKIKITDNATGYLYRMAKNSTLNYIRDSKRYVEVNDSCLDIVSNNNEFEEFEIMEYKNALYECIDQLPARCKEVLILHRVEQMKQKEISEKLGISVKTIKNQLWASLQRLKKCLEKKDLFIF